MVTPAARREAVTILVETYEMSERRACQVIGADRSSVRYASRRPDDTVLRERMKEVAHDRRRFGYRRVHVLLKAEGLVVNRKKTERLYREEGLKVRRRRGCQCRSNFPQKRRSKIPQFVISDFGLKVPDFRWPAARSW